MAKNKKVPAQVVAPAPQVPAAPTTLGVDQVNNVPSYQIPHSYFELNGANRFNATAASEWNEKANAFEYKYNQTDNEKTQDTLNNQLLNNSLTGANSVISGINDPAEREQYRQDLYQPVQRELESAYNRNVGQGINRANALGTLDSVSFGDYIANQVQKNYANSTADAMSNANIQSYQLPSIKLAPYLDASALAQSGIDASQNRQLAYLDPTFRSQFMGASAQNDKLGQQLGAVNQQNQTNQMTYSNNYNNANMLNSYNQNAANAANAYNLSAYQLQNANKGFFSRLF